MSARSTQPTRAARGRSSTAARSGRSAKRDTHTDPTNNTAIQHALLLLPVAELVDHPANVHLDLGDLSELAESIRREGILEPLLVTPLPDGRHQLIEGHRRKHAALTTTRTHALCVVREDLATADGQPSAEQIATMLEVNEHQRGLTNQERAAGYAQMVAFAGWTPAKVAKRLGVDTDEVKRAVSVAKFSTDVQAVVHAHNLTLDDAAALADFEDQPKIHAKLLDKLSAGAGSYVIDEERRRQELATAKKTIKATLAEQGCPIIPDSGWHFPRKTVAQPLENLRDGRNRALNSSKHARCPGHAAFLRSNSFAAEPVTVTYVCTDPEANGHTLRMDYAERADAIAKAAEKALTPEQIEARATADEEARLAWATATRARRDWLGRLVRARALNADLARTALGASRPRGRTSALALALVTGTEPRDDQHKAERAYDKLLATAPVATLHRHTVAFYCADAEEDAERLDIAERAPWSTWHLTRAARWLRFLLSLGYTATEIEQQLLDRVPVDATEEHDLDADEADDGTDGSDVEQDPDEDIGSADAGRTATDEPNRTPDTGASVAA